MGSHSRRSQRGMILVTRHHTGLNGMLVLSSAGVMSTQAASAQNHDDRYYTEAEVNALLAVSAQA